MKSVFIFYKTLKINVLDGGEFLQISLIDHMKAFGFQ